MNFGQRDVMQVYFTAVLSITWPAGQNWPFGSFCWALLRKYFCNCYWPFDGPLFIEMQEFTWIGLRNCTLVQV